ncbi:glycosyltransferase [Microbacterium rhizomatis]|uniref:Glycosyltransferase family 2 protein n=1 Tax=Microbacterium rhizomatis TaxID=1631477 RepID=A0A5J5J875_9MICO|nr:glycosyltransferase [Microbacterium rhizomatis]KAA9111215.1 glycosyltransferase family 2 protein [Microbacterium rhizomatis]
MPSRVHAILVVRPDGRAPAAFHLRRTLAALEAQHRRVDALTIVLCGGDESVRQLAAASGAESVITTTGSTRFAAATALATIRLTGDAVWLLAQDTAPEPEALARLAGALELAPSVAFVAPKLVQWDDRTQIVSLGVSMTTLGRSMGLSDGQLDQGQHDAEEDVLGADVRGLLVRTDAWRQLAGLDPALLGADEGLDLGVRARLAGARISLVPTALIAVAGDGAAGVPAGDARRSRRAFAQRTAQLHRRLAYARPWAVFFVWLAILPIALWRTVLHLIAKHPFLVVTEWGASALALVRVGAVARARGRIRAARRAPWSQVAPLRVTRTDLRERFDIDGEEAVAPVGEHIRGDIRFFSGGGAWLVLAALVISVAAFPALLAWPVLGGGALAPMRATVAQLWADAAYGVRAAGLDAIGPADPFAAVVAVIGSLWPGDPSRAIVLLWLAALPLAALGGWFAATRVTERSSLRIVAGAVWMLAPTFLAGLAQGRPGAVIVHLLLPWLFYAGAVAHRSWAAAGAASVLFAAVVACAPSLAPALVLLVIGAIIVAIASRAGRGVARQIWVLVPAVVLFAPLVWSRLRSGDVWGLVADPGVPFLGDRVGADPTGRALLAAGFPTSDPGGWSALLAGTGVPVWWVPLLAAPVALLALIAPLTRRWAAGVALLVIAAIGLSTAFVVVGIAVSSLQSTSIPLWPGPALSLAWLGVVGAATVTLDSALVPRLRAVRSLAAAVAVIAVAVLAVPTLATMTRGTPPPLANGPVSTLPAYVDAEGASNPDVGTIVLTPLSDGGVSTRIIWGGSETLGGQWTVAATPATATEGDTVVAGITADLVTSTADDVIDRLAAAGVGFVLLTPAATPETDAARTFRLMAETAIDQRDALDSVGATPKGELWRVTGAVQPRASATEAVQTSAQWIAFAQIAVILAALLLAVPTRASRRQARRTPRIVGPYVQEER